MRNKSTLSEKWWWRTLVVIYVFFWISALIICFIIGYLERPQKIQSHSKVNINCNKQENNFSFEPSSSFIPISVNIRLSKTDDNYASKLCEYGLSRSDYAQLPSVPKNYTAVLHFDNYSSWNRAGALAGVSLLILFMAIEGLKSTLLYILGINILSGVPLYILKYLAMVTNYHEDYPKKS